jgi:hypothetical protein
MTGETIMKKPRRDDRDPAPESAMGGGSDMGAHGRHPVSGPELKREQFPVDPDAALGDAPIERRRALDPNYRGEERRIARR